MSSHNRTVEAYHKARKALEAARRGMWEALSAVTDLGYDSLESNELQFIYWTALPEIDGLLRERFLRDWPSEPCWPRAISAPELQAKPMEYIDA